MLTAIAHEEESAPEPRSVIDILARIIESNDPRLRHVHGKFSINYLLRGIVPERMFESALRNAWKLDRQS